MAVGYSLTSPPLWRLPHHLYCLYYGFVGFQTIYFSPPPSSPFSSPFPSGFRPHPCPRSYPRPRPCSRPRFLPPVPDTRFSSRYTTSSDRRRVLGPKLQAACRRYFLSTEMMPRAEWQWLIFYSSFLLMWPIPKPSSSLPFLSTLVPIPVSTVCVYVYVCIY